MQNSTMQNHANAQQTRRAIEGAGQDARIAPAQPPQLMGRLNDLHCTLNQLEASLNEVESAITRMIGSRPVPPVESPNKDPNPPNVLSVLNGLNVYAGFLRDRLQQCANTLNETV